MPSPFPGMNPFLEQGEAWPDFHNDFIVRIRESLNERIGINYIAKIEVRLILHERSADERKFFGVADVAVSDRANRPAGSAATVPTAPVQLELPAIEVEKHRSIEIRDQRDRRLVAVIELLSPSNKTAGPDRDDYLAKRRQVLASHVHLVEIDLRRGGTRPDLPDLPPCDYYALVSRYVDRPRVGFWPFGLRDALPSIPIPLSPPDPPAMLDLKSVLDKSYDAGGYEKYIYEGAPEPPLSPDDLAWAKTFVPNT